MNGVVVVTSCSYRGWRDYGERFVVTFLANWPASAQLVVVSEDQAVLDALTIMGSKSRLTGYDLCKVSLGAKDFLARHARTPWVAGDARAPRPKGVGHKWTAREGYWFRWDAYKFCRKVFAIQAVAHLVGSGLLFWIDADVVTFARVPEELYIQVLPIQVPLSCLSREGYHSECGFVGYNLDHSHALPFLDRFAELYALDTVFQLDEWHDSWVFDWLRTHLAVETYLIPHKNASHPFINSVLGAYMDHCKGARKKAGRSPPREQQGHKDVAYWRV